MYMLTNEQWEAITDVAWNMITEVVDFKSLPKEQQDRIIRSDMAIVEATKRKRKTNKRTRRTREYIAEKRKIDKNYAR